MDVQLGAASLCVTLRSCREMIAFSLDYESRPGRICMITGTDKVITSATPAAIKGPVYLARITDGKRVRRVPPEWKETSDGVARRDGGCGSRDTRLWIRIYRGAESTPANIEIEFADASERTPRCVYTRIFDGIQERLKGSSYSFSLFSRRKEVRLTRCEYISASSRARAWMLSLPSFLCNNCFQSVFNCCWNASAMFVEANE